MATLHVEQVELGKKESKRKDMKKKHRNEQPITEMKKKIEVKLSEIQALSTE
jgi:hypothetical protein